MLKSLVFTLLFVGMIFVLTGGVALAQIGLDFDFSTLPGLTDEERDMAFRGFGEGNRYGGGSDGVEEALETVNNIFQAIIPIVITLAVIYFFWGLAKYILSAGNEESKAEGRNIMIYGIIALFIMVSVWGIVGLLQETFGVDGVDSSQIIDTGIIPNI